MKKALIKKTGEIFDVIDEYSMFKIEYKWPTGLADELKPIDREVRIKSGKEKEEYYVLSNEETYKYDDLIVGIDEIREWKLKNFL